MKNEGSKINPRFLLQTGQDRTGQQSNISPTQPFKVILDNDDDDER